MGYTNPDTMTEVANILDSFDEENLRDIFRSQILDTDSYTDMQINHLAPLYSSYQKVLQIENMDEDDKAEVVKRFQTICLNIINFICSKFSIELDNEWISENINRLPAITMCMYQFFVLDLFSILLQAANNYISKNSEDLYTAFMDTTKKDVSSSSNGKSMNPKYAVIASCIFDVVDYSFASMDSESIIDYIDKKYTPGTIIKLLMDEGAISGDFGVVFGNIFKENLPLRSKIAFELIFKIKEQGYLMYNPLVIRDYTKPDPEPTHRHQNTDIDDDVDEE